jgi:hypothetical protein
VKERSVLNTDSHKAGGVDQRYIVVVVNWGAHGEPVNRKIHG